MLWLWYNNLCDFGTVNLSDYTLSLCELYFENGLETYYNPWYKGFYWFTL